jgi:hypothetical protein
MTALVGFFALSFVVNTYAALGLTINIQESRNNMESAWVVQFAGVSGAGWTEFTLLKESITVSKSVSAITEKC